eukprot:GILK01002268.1.p1 GENE.GILK01002268.1~~GILK01002268.1.p1  ORF type:complete len:338 (+),score=34.01 GILK01002268.1:68-1015(+)
MANRTWVEDGFTWTSCPVPYWGDACQFTYKDAVGDTYTTSQVVYAVVSGIILCVASWRLFLLGQKQGWMVRSTVDTQRVLYYLIWFDILCVFILSFDPFGYAGTIPIDVIYVLGGLTGACCLSGLYTILFYWHASLSLRAGPPQLSRRTNMILIFLHVSTWIIGFIDPVFQHSSIKGSQNFFWGSILGLAGGISVVNGWRVKSQLAHGTVTVDALRKAIIRKMLLLLGIIQVLVLILVAFQYYVGVVLVLGGSQKNQVPTSMPVDAVFLVKFVVPPIVLLFFRKIHSKKPPLAAQMAAAHTNTTGSAKSDGRNIV